MKTDDGADRIGFNLNTFLIRGKLIKTVDGMIVFAVLPDDVVDETVTY